MIHENVLSDYIVQRKVDYKIFKTDDGLEKIIELHFMTAHTRNKINIVPMVRIGHCIKKDDNTKIYKIHFGDNNRLGYGFDLLVIILSMIQKAIEISNIFIQHINPDITH